jgi:hypothetical protein
MLPRMRPLIWLVVAFNALLVIAMATGTPLSGHTWFLGNLVLGVLWVASSPRRRTCSRCRTEVSRTFHVCPVCRHDFYRPLPPRRPRSAGQS